jgi:chaperonin cofactor prefoldin
MEQALIAMIAATPPLAGVAWKVFSELKKIGRSVNGELEEKFERLHVRFDDISEDMRDIRAEVRDVKADHRQHRQWHEGDGR